MDNAPRFAKVIELEQGLPEVTESPRDTGRLEAIVVRPAEDVRQSLAEAELSPEGGIVGDRWAFDHWQKLPDGRPDPRSQVSLMNARILRRIAGEESAISLAGDNLIVDFDLSEANLPAGRRVAIGTVVLELTNQSHTGCRKFSQRYGEQARQFINGPRGKPLNLRGRFARVITGGTIAVGAVVRKL